MTAAGGETGLTPEQVEEFCRQMYADFITGNPRDPYLDKISHETGRPYWTEAENTVRAIASAAAKAERERNIKADCIYCRKQEATFTGDIGWHHPEVKSHWITNCDARHIRYDAAIRSGVRKGEAHEG